MSKQNRFKLSAVSMLALASLVSGFCITAAAEEQTEADTPEESALYLSLSEEVTTPSRGISENVLKVPSNVTVIDQEDIKNSNAQTLVELLRPQQSVTVKNTAGSAAKSEVDIRGFGEAGASNCLVLIDGRRLNNIDISNVDWSQIPMDRVEKIEIIRGPGAVLYGDNATGGVINIITKTAKEDSKLSLHTSFGSYAIRNIKVNAEGRNEGFSYIFGISNESNNGYRKNNKYEASDLGLNLKLRKSEKTGFEFSAGLHNDELGLPGALSENLWSSGQYTESTHPNDRASSNDRYSQLTCNNTISDMISLQTSVSWRHRDSYFYYYTGFGNFFQLSKSNISGIGEKMVYNSPVGSITAGIEAYFAGLDNFDLNNNGTPGIMRNQAKKDSTAGYLNNNASLITDKLLLELGVRIEHADYNFASPGVNDAKSSLYADANSIGLTWLYNSNGSLFLSASKSFRLPKTDEYYSIDFSNFPFQYQLNSSLKPQQSNNTELGVKQGFLGNMAATLTLYQIDTRNEIYLNPLTYNDENYDNTKRTGIELGYNYKPADFLSLFLNYSLCEAKFGGSIYDGKTVPDVPENKASVGAHLDLGKNCSLSLNSDYIGERYFISDQANALERQKAYTVMGTRVAWDLKDFSVFLAVNNTTDEKFSSYGVSNSAGAKNYYPSDGRNFLIGIEAGF